MSLPSILECERGLAALAEAQPSGDLARAVAFGRALLHYVRNAGTPAPMPQTVKQQAQSLPLLPRGVAMHLARAPERKPAAVAPRAEPKALPPSPAVKRSTLPASALEGLPANGLGLMVDTLAQASPTPTRPLRDGSRAAAMFEALQQAAGAELVSRALAEAAGVDPKQVVSIMTPLVSSGRVLYRFDITERRGYYRLPGAQQ